jgi:hypothetical protein
MGYSFEAPIKYVQQHYDESGDPMALSLLRSFAPAR